MKKDLQEFVDMYKTEEDEFEFYDYFTSKY